MTVTLHSRAFMRNYKNRNANKNCFASKNTELFNKSGRLYKTKSIITMAVQAYMNGVQR